MAHSTAKVQLVDLSVTGSVEGATAPVSGSYRFEVSLDPGDGTKTSSLTVPIRCTAAVPPNATAGVRSGNAQGDRPAVALGSSPSYTG